MEVDFFSLYVCLSEIHHNLPPDARIFAHAVVLLDNGPHSTAENGETKRPKTGTTSRLLGYVD